MMFNITRHRIFPTQRRWTAVLGLALISAGTVFSLAATAQPADQNAEQQTFTAVELQELTGPIALYPDDLISIVLPASTYPLQIVQAARFLDDYEQDNSLEPDDEWDNAVVALLNYPEVLRMMNDDLDWTWALGGAVLNQQAAVFDAIQIFRDRAYAAGNLQSDDRQIVTEEDGVIEITPVDPEVVYIPYYEPERVVVYQRRPVYYYYPRPYPVYYYPYPYGYSFTSGLFWGVTSAFSIGWQSHYLHVHHHSHADHPYYRRSYYTPYYARRGVNININLNHVAHVWQPNQRRGVRPYRGYVSPRVRRTDNRGPRTANTYRTNRDSRTGRDGVIDTRRRVTRNDANRNLRTTQRRAGASRNTVDRVDNNGRVGARSGSIRSGNTGLQREQGQDRAVRQDRQGRTNPAQARDTRRNTATQPNRPSRSQTTRPSRTQPGRPARQAGNRGNGNSGGNAAIANSQRTLGRVATRPTARSDTRRAQRASPNASTANRGTAPNRTARGSPQTRPTVSRSQPPARSNANAGNRTIGRVASVARQNSGGVARAGRSNGNRSSSARPAQQSSRSGRSGGGQQNRRAAGQGRRAR